MKRHMFLLALLCLIINTLHAQDYNQTIRGTILDAESQQPLIGATISIMTTDPVMGTTTDFDGQFRIDEVPIGRHDIQLDYLGYETVFLSNQLIGTGKELVLNLGMEESAQTLETVEISAEKSYDKTKALNEFASLSSRTFSVEETSRYAAAIYDPARMAQNYAGVSVGAGSDLYNEIVVRGNSSAGILWRLEGIEVPNPNHFGELGSSGGAVSMLSSTTLSNSDFYTGAFPSEFGNATAGVFDLNLRAGNNEKRESSVMIGALGIEVGTEGPFSKKSKASYLVNYRYSTLALIQAMGVNPTGDVLPTYQDLSFKVNVPTQRLGTFSLFGLAGDNLAATIAAKDSTQWEYESDREEGSNIGRTGTIGLSHRYLINDRSYLRTVVAASHQAIIYEQGLLNYDYVNELDYQEDITENSYRINSTYNYKFSPQLSLRAGGIYTHKDFDFLSEYAETPGAQMQTAFSGAATNGYLQAFAQAKYKLSPKVKINTGMHFTQMSINNKVTVEPRAAISWQLAPGHELSLASGLHSKVEHLSLYSMDGEWRDGTIARGNENLGTTKSWHNVIGYDFIINDNMRLKTEAYYQYLYDVLIWKEGDQSFSILNSNDMWDNFALNGAVQEGNGRNIGLDVTLEKFFADSYYFMMTGSIYDSKFKTFGDTWYNTRYNGNYQCNLIGGKEFKMGKSDKNIFGVNGKLVMAGGNRVTPIDLEASLAAEDEVRRWDMPFSGQEKGYGRMDLGVSYKINTKNITHTIRFDVQNVTNRQNIFVSYFDDDTFTVENAYQTGFFPFFNYRVEF